jgi:lysophospholipase L1-like esterase
MKIYIVGDSISIQYGPYLKAYLDGSMDYSRKESEEEALLNLDNPQGANGGDSSMVLSFLRAKIESGGIDTDLLLINCGLHDIRTDPNTGKRQVLIDAYAENLRAIVETVDRMKPTLVWIRSTPCDEVVHNNAGLNMHRFSADCDDYNRVADEIMNETGVPSLDLYTFTKSLGSDLYCDHVHFHEHIREKQAAFIAGWLMGYKEMRSG